jgi:hypothetical protein
MDGTGTGTGTGTNTEYVDLLAQFERQSVNSDDIYKRILEIEKQDENKKTNDENSQVLGEVESALFVNLSINKVFSRLVAYVLRTFNALLRNDDVFLIPGIVLGGENKICFGVLLLILCFSLYIFDIIV